MVFMDRKILGEAYRLMTLARSMAGLFETRRHEIPYVHSTSTGHEAIQIATGIQLRPWDFVSPYYRDDAMMLAMGFTPLEMIRQLLAKRDDPFSGGRSYYGHPSSKRRDMPLIPHQSSATGMQAIPATGMAQGVHYFELIGKPIPSHLEREIANPGHPLVLCSLGDASIGEGEVSEAFQFAALKQLPIIFLVQDNNWCISATSKETRTGNAYEWLAGFKGIGRMTVDGSDFLESYDTMKEAFEWVREMRKPVLVHASVPLLGHHTSGVRREWYRGGEEWESELKRDPLAKITQSLIEDGFTQEEIKGISDRENAAAEFAFSSAIESEEPDPAHISDHIFAPTPVIRETGNRVPENGKKVLMVDAGLHALEEILEQIPESVFFGQDVGSRLGGVFREAATLGGKFGEHRVFNTAIQEAYIMGSTVGLSAVGVKPIVEIQFGDYIFPGFNQLVTEVSKSCYLTQGKFPVQALIRVPVGAYGGGGPYHSGSIESFLLAIKGIKLVYPSNSADFKGLFKAAFLDPNPVIMLEHKGLYWNKLPGTQESQTIEPDESYILPLGVANKVLTADPAALNSGESVCIISYGMGIYWALSAAEEFPGLIEIIDLRTLYPLDEELIYSRVLLHGNCLVLTEESEGNSFAESLAQKISSHCFEFLDGPVLVLGALDLPAVPMNIRLEQEMLPGISKVRKAIETILFR